MKSGSAIRNKRACERTFGLTYFCDHLQPLLHAIVFIVQFTMCTILVRKFNGYYSNRPVLTTMITNAVSPYSSVSLQPH
jgi:hypothetical protein